MRRKRENRGEEAARHLRQQLQDWLKAHGRYRSNLAGAIVVLDALKSRCPLSDEDVFTDGEVKRGRGRALFAVLDKYGIQRFLKDGTTTRGARSSCASLLQAIEYGRALVGYSSDERSEIVDSLIDLVRRRVSEWLARHPLRVGCDPAASAVTWVDTILSAAREHLSQGRVEQHLVGAKLQKRHPQASIGLHAATAGDEQTGRPGDFQMGDFIYHVTVAPTGELMEKCRDNLQANLRPIVLVPRQLAERAKGLASGQGIEERVHVWAIEDFVAQNVAEIAADAGATSIDVLRDVIELYNERVGEAEVDPALRIELK